MDGNASGKSATSRRGCCSAQSASTFETRCYERVLRCEQQGQSSALFRDAELVDSPKEAKTFWLPGDACPTTSLERLAKAIFDFHTKNRRQHPWSVAEKNETRRNGDGGIPRTAPASHPSCAKSGAEWWVQRREEGHHANLGMPFHWDKDEHMLDQRGEVRCPAVSTVTYLTDHGAPTVVLESRVSERGAVEHGDIERAFVSYPALFKHLAFDGGFLHGVPEQLMRTGEGSTRNSSAASPSARSGRKRGRMRVTLLVNVWLSHRPEGIAPLPPELAATLSSRDASASPLLSFDRPVAFFPVSIGTDDEALVRRQEADEFSVGETGGSTMVINAPLGPTLFLELQAPTPGILSVDCLRALHSFALVHREGSLARISTESGGGACGVGRVECSTMEEGSTDEDRAERSGGGCVEGGVGRGVAKAAEQTSRKRKQ